MKNLPIGATTVVAVARNIKVQPGTIKFKILFNVGVHETPQTSACPIDKLQNAMDVFGDACGINLAYHGCMENPTMPKEMH